MCIARRCVSVGMTGTSCSLGCRPSTTSYHDMMQKRRERAGRIRRGRSTTEHTRKGMERKGHIKERKTTSMPRQRYLRGDKLKPPYHTQQNKHRIYSRRECAPRATITCKDTATRCCKAYNEPFQVQPQEPQRYKSEKKKDDMF